MMKLENCYGIPKTGYGRIGNP